MTKKNILIAVVTFLVGFGSTFYIIRTYFPKQKVEQTTKENVTLIKSKN